MNIKEFFTRNRSQGIATAIGAILFGVIVVVIFIVGIMSLGPNRNDPAKWGTVHVELVATDSSSFTEYHRNEARQALQELSRLGPTFALGRGGVDTIRVVSTDLTNGTSGGCALHGAAIFLRSVDGEPEIRIDPTCTRGGLEFQTALMHEIGHALGMRHICQSSDMGRTDCSSVGRGVAIMNPHITYDSHESNAVTSSNPGPISTFHLQDLDFKEFDRVAVPGQRLIQRVATDPDGGV